MYGSMVFAHGSVRHMKKYISRLDLVILSYCVLIAVFTALISMPSAVSAADVEPESSVVDGLDEGTGKDMYEKIFVIADANPSAECNTQVEATAAAECLEQADTYPAVKEVDLLSVNYPTPKGGGLQLPGSVNVK